VPATITPLQKPKQASRNLTQEIENGKHKEPGIYVARKIARALRVSMDYLTGVYEADDSELFPTMAGVA
jgi:transcriptional regulator with XRE-family HTH domain